MFGPLIRAGAGFIGAAFLVTVFSFAAAPLLETHQEHDPEPSEHAMWMELVVDNLAILFLGTIIVGLIAAAVVRRGAVR